MTGAPLAARRGIAGRPGAGGMRLAGVAYLALNDRDSAYDASTIAESGTGRIRVPSFPRVNLTTPQTAGTQRSQPLEPSGPVAPTPVSTGIPSA